MSGIVSLMAAKARTKASARLKRAKKKRGDKVSARLKEIAEGKAKRKGSGRRGLARDDLEILRDGPA